MERDASASIAKTTWSFLKGLRDQGKLDCSQEFRIELATAKNHPASKSIVSASTLVSLKIYLKAFIVQLDVNARSAKILHQVRMLQKEITVH